MFKLIVDPKNRKAEIQIKGSAKATRKGIRAAFYYLGRDLKATANKNILAKPRSGREEVFRGRKRRASVRGESFANRSGDARKKLGFFTQGSDRMEFGFRQDAATLYTKTLETELDRPTLKIAVDANNRNAQVHFEREIERAHKK